MSTPLTPVREVRRRNDWEPEQPGELVGLLLPADGDQWVPATVFGAALGPATDVEGAESLVRERGLSSLAERWWLRVAGAPWREAWLLEVKRDRVRLRWEDPMLLQPGHGEWVRTDGARLQLTTPTT